MAEARGRGWVRALRIGACVLAAPFVVWLFVYGMPLSGLHAVAGLWAMWPTATPGSTSRRVGAVAVFALALLTVPTVGLREYADTTQTLHCRALGFMGKPPHQPPGWRADEVCDPDDLADGARVAKEGGALYSARERLGIHGFNHVLALGGVVTGFSEVAAETVWMSWAEDPLGDATRASTATRRLQCRGSYADGAGAPRAAAKLWESDFPMRSPAVRTLLAEGVRRLPKTPGAKISLGEVHWSTGGNDDFAGYERSLRKDSLSVALALEVGDSRLSVTRREDGRVDAAWDGTIHYPGVDVAFNAPLPFQRRILRVSETAFCGMQVDGAMNPYDLHITWVLDEGDDRLSARGVTTPERTLFEQVVLGAALTLGL